MNTQSALSVESDSHINTAYKAISSGVHLLGTRIKVLTQKSDTQTQNFAELAKTANMLLEANKRQRDALAGKVVVIEISFLDAPIMKRVIDDLIALQCDYANVVETLRVERENAKVQADANVAACREIKVLREKLKATRPHPVALFAARPARKTAKKK